MDAHYPSLHRSANVMSVHSIMSIHEGPIFLAKSDYLYDGMGFDVQEVIADRGYGRWSTYCAFRQLKICTYILVNEDRSSDKRYAAPSEDDLFPKLL